MILTYKYRIKDRSARKTLRQDSATRYRDKVQRDPVLRAKRNAATRAWRQSKLAHDPEFRQREYERRKGRRSTAEKWAAAQVAAIKIRAAKEGIAFDLTKEWLLSVIPAECPIFRAPFVFGVRSPMNASVDRLLPAGGYTTDNVCVISQEANLIKRRCADPEIFQRIGEWLKVKLAQRRDDESREVIRVH